VQVAPNVLCIRPKRQSIQVKIGSIVVLIFESMCNTKIDPNSHIIRPYIQSSVIKLDGFVCSSEMGQSGSYFIHKKVVRGVEIECSIE
jgi:hypothetical protein